MAVGDDFTPFFNTSHFAKAATYTPGVGSPSTVNGIFDNEYLEKNGVGGYYPVFTCAESDVSGVSNGDTVEIDSVTYTVREYIPDGSGEIDLILEAP